ncbi:MAG TPA: diguanylate cyclase [Bryobacteraceae bacterium]|nr:diguanylate cyclase [Bryobacteraceae bacterium]
MPLKGRIYIATITAGGATVLLYAVIAWQSTQVARFGFYLLFAMCASQLKVRLPGVTGTMSVGNIFVLLSATCLSIPQTILIGCGGVLTQCLLHAKRRPKPVQLCFNVANSAIGGWVAAVVWRSPALRSVDSSMPVMLFWACVCYFLVNTMAVSGVIALTEGKRIWSVWYESFFWTAPQYLFAAAVAWLADLASARFGWESSVLILPAIFLVERSYSLYLGRLEQEKTHVAAMADLHLRTIKALALAIDAKDEKTHDHLQRVQIYATELAKEMGASEEEIQALQAAALLHDIGKLAVPEYIISKPGRLTPEEFEKMKVHPVVGAEILETVNFPCPVVPIVRSHHEKWNGSGYPDGIKGEQIPLGARILAAVDCLDAMASERQYRRALALDEVIAYIISEAGKSFDPAVVEILARRYKELEALARQAPTEQMKLTSRRSAASRQCAPAAGFEASAGGDGGHGPAGFVTSIAAARQEFQMLHEVTRDLGNSLSMADTLSLLASRLKSMIPYDTIAVYLVDVERLKPVYVSGADARLFSSLSIQMGEGLSGWVAENRKPILNGNPSVESGYLDDPTKFATLRSAIAVPLEGLDGILGVLTLYHAQADAFSRDHLRVLLAVSSKAGVTIENAREFQQAQASAVTDGLTELPNARSLFLHLDSELMRASRENATVGTLVLDLDGFKQVNDVFGHMTGNRLLQAVAATLRQSCREYDYVGRMGGDEFVLILPRMSREMMQSRAEELKQMVIESGRRVIGTTDVSASIGCALYPDDGRNAEELLGRADQRMYRAKRSHHAALRATAMLQDLPASTVTVQ